MKHDPNTPLSDHVSGGMYAPRHGDTKADGSPIVTANIMGPTIAELDVIAGLVGERPTIMFVTSTKWETIANEVSIMIKKPNPDNFRRLQLRNLTIINSCSEDQEAVNLLNVPEARACDFQNRRQRLISGRK